MVVQKLKPFRLKNHQSDIVLALELNHYNFHHISELIEEYVFSIKVEDDEHILIINRDESIFYASIGDVIIIDSVLQVFNMNNRAFYYLYEEAGD